MSKPLVLFRGPIETRSGYGAHARDVLEALYKMNLYGKIKWKFGILLLGMK